MSQGIVIEVDTREKQKAITKILATFRDNGVKAVSTKLWVGDYRRLDNPMIVVDRKQNLNEVANNVCQDHDRFRRELIRAQEVGIKIVILVEHNKRDDDDKKKIRSISDVVWWDNPRRHKRVRDADGNWRDIETKAIEGDKLAKIMRTLEEKYGCKFAFCCKEDTGSEILRILSEGAP